MKSKKKSKKAAKKTPDKRLAISFPGVSKKTKHANGGEASHVIRKRKLYSQEALHAAYKAVKDSSISVNAAAKQYGVPLTTLRDRVDGRISINTTRPGPPLLMSKDEEAEIAHFLHTMAKYGYRYTRLEMAEIATDQAVEKGKRRPKSNGLTTKWVDSFINRWPAVRELSLKYKNKTEAEITVRTYFEEIKKIIDRYRLLDKSGRIFNIMEINLHTDHSFSPEFGGKTGSHQFKTENSTNTTLIACGTVTGQVLPPYFVLQASKLRPEMLRGCDSSVNASVSDTGKCSPQIFRRYLNEHFLPYAQRFESEPILILMDGSKSHMFVGMSEWGRANNVIFSFIPAHTTHLLQPLEVECAEAIQKRYENACRRHLRSSTGPCISRNSICELACQAYYRVVTRLAVVSSFKKAGVYPDVSSDDSGDDMDRDDDLAYNSKSDDMDHDHDMYQEEVVYTEDLVVGQNQEVTEEEVVTTQEVILSEDGQTEEVVITPDGQFLLAPGADAMVSPEGHLIIQGGEIFVDGGEGELSQLLIHSEGSESEQSSPLKPELFSGASLPETQCIINNGKIISSRSSEPFADYSFNSSSDTDFGRDRFDDSHSHLSCGLDNSRVKTIIKTELLVDIGEQDNGQSDKLEDDDSGSENHTELLQRVFDIIQKK